MLLAAGRNLRLSFHALVSSCPNILYNESRYLRRQPPPRKASLRIHAGGTAAAVRSERWIRCDQANPWNLLRMHLGCCAAAREVGSNAIGPPPLGCYLSPVLRQPGCLAARRRPDGLADCA